MSPKAYAHAFIELLNAGTRADEALSGLDAALARKGHGKLKRQILTIVARTLDAKRGDTAELSIAKLGDEKQYKDAIKAVCEALDVTKPQTVVDETLIGGFVLTTGTKRVDRSYKRTLFNLSRSIINSSRT